MKLDFGSLNLALTTFAILIFVNPTGAFFRHLCHGQLGIARVDPIMAPGKVSQHVHNIQGAQNFGLDVDNDHLMASNCTSCSVRQDKSAYWTPQMYFQHDNGTFELVTTSGGLTAYYFTEPPFVPGKPTTMTLTPFPKGFRMIAGTSTKRKFYGAVPDPDESFWTDYDRTQQSLMEKSIGFNCMGNSVAPEGALERHSMPERAKIDTCYEGIRAELQFPSCWNGVDLDSDNHTQHVAYPYLLRNGACPEGFDVRLPTLFYETIYNTQAFIGQPGQFVFAHGDPTGNGYHGDFMNGWDEGVMQQVLDQCVGETGSGQQEDCPVLDIKPDSEILSCTMETPEVLQSEEVNLVDELPGGCQVQADVDFVTNCGKVVPENPASSVTSIPTSTESTSNTTPANTTAPMTVDSSPISTSDPLANNTSTTAPPTTTPAPSTASFAQGEVATYTSSTVSNGTMLYYVLVEEIVTTTVVVDGAQPTPDAPPVIGGVKRHLHGHGRETSKTTGHGHGHGKQRKAIRNRV